jgi:HTH-type transcriptional regulator/antitoxin HigA
MNIRAIHTDDDYQWALKEIRPYFENEPEPNTEDGDRFDVLTILIEAYENEYQDVPDASPREVLHFAIESMGHTQTELAELIGGRPRASEVLRGKRNLTLDMIRKISDAWRIPADALIGAPVRQREAA